MASPETTAVRLIGLLAEPDRLAVVAALALGAGTATEVAAAAGLDAKAVSAALVRLRKGGLVGGPDSALTLRVEVFKGAARAAAPMREPVDHGSGDPRTEAVLRAFVRDGRIVAMPAARGKRRLLLEHLVTMFEPGVRYPEREVDTLLRAWHDDYVTLRRYLVDEALLSRESGEYWRSGGPVTL